jgi:hypothetical protein
MNHPIEQLSEPPTEIIKLNPPATITWQEMVKRLAKRPEEIMAQMNPWKARLLAENLYSALRSSARVDSAKKVAIYNKDQVNVPNVFSPTAESFLEMTTEQAALLHAAIGMFGEAGEILDNVLRHIGGAPLDRENAIEESGDLDFYHEDYRRNLGFTEAEARQSNMDKLGKRYPGFIYSDASAAARLDKVKDIQETPLPTGNFPGSSL